MSITEERDAFVLERRDLAEWLLNRTLMSKMRVIQRDSEED